MQEFGFTIPKRDIIVNDVRVRGCGHSKTSVTHHLSHSSVLPPVKKVSRMVHILHTVHHILLKVLTRRICLTIKSFFSW